MRDVRLKSLCTHKKAFCMVVNFLQIHTKQSKATYSKYTCKPKCAEIHLYAKKQMLQIHTR